MPVVFYLGLFELLYSTCRHAVWAYSFVMFYRFTTFNRFTMTKTTHLQYIWIGSTSSNPNFWLAYGQCLLISPSILCGSTCGFVHQLSRGAPRFASLDLLQNGIGPVESISLCLLLCQLPNTQQLKGLKRIEKAWKGMFPPCSRVAKAANLLSHTLTSDIRTLVRGLIVVSSLIYSQTGNY